MAFFQTVNRQLQFFYSLVALNLFSTDPGSGDANSVNDCVYLQG